MQQKLPVPPREAVFYEDEKTYACLATEPMAPGHTVVVWRADAEDLHVLSRTDFEYLMDVVDRVRTAMLSALTIEKVYLLYMDEVKQVHWHLVPRYNEKGLSAFQNPAATPGDYSLAVPLRTLVSK
ncbi:MAG: HIT domain-containing protein [bacterium]|nr:HIT domain-containing protein [bacterium]